MENKPARSLRELTEIIRNCNSSKEMEHVVSDLQTQFISYNISDQSFLLALIGVTLMNLTADPLSSSICRMDIPRLLSRINWKDVNPTIV